MSDQTTRLGRADARSAGGGGMSRKAVIGGLIAVCAVGGILVAVLSGGGGNPKQPRQAPVAEASAAGSASASTGSSAGGSPSALGPDAQAQAQALANLLGQASASRQAVVGAVASIGKCDNPAAAQQALTQASGQRQQLLTSLTALKVDKLPTGPQLVQQLTQAWQASASADDAYAAWAGDAAGGCDPAKVSGDAHKQAGDQASGTASGAKKQAAATWNAIAGQAGLSTLNDYQL